MEEVIEVSGTTLKWSRIVDAAPFVRHALTDMAGREVARGVLREEALRAARLDILSRKPAHTLTLDEFREIAMIIPVCEGRGKSGEAMTGKVRYLIDDPCDARDMVGQLRREGMRCYKAAGYAELAAVGDTSVMPQDKWVSEFVSVTLKHYGSTEVSVLSAKEEGRQIGRPVILVNTRGRAITLQKESLLKMAYEFYSEKPDDGDDAAPRVEKMK